MRKLSPALLACSVLTLMHADERVSTPALMPLPARYMFGSGSLRIDSSFRVDWKGFNETRMERAVARFTNRLARQTGFTFRTAPGPAALTVICAGAGKPVQELGEDESYHLAVNTDGATLRAAQPLGVLRGLETFLQSVQPGPHGFAVAAISIDDHPRFPWRGLMLDASRHFMPVDQVKRTLDGMAVVKLNVFHWHLSDNQGFRVESRVFPRLQETGSGGLFYMQNEIRGVIAYARDRGIRVVPEFDMPGHATGMLVAYPQLATAPAPREIDHLFGVFDAVMDPSKSDVYAFLDRFIGEMASLFPDAYLHIGGDEVNGKLWRESTRVQQFKLAHQMLPSPEDPDANAAFHAYFNRNLQAIVQKHGKHMQGWDEILSPTLPRDILIQSWRGPASLARAARLGYESVLSSGWYLDLCFSAEQHYLVDPLAGEADSLPPEQQKRILGGEAAMWSEYITPETADSRIWPRAAAVAERLWSPREVRDVPDMYRRLNYVSGRLDFEDLRHHSWQEPMLDRLAGASDADALRVFAETVEPVKDYERESFGPYTTETPLIQFVDAAPPESDASRRFNASVKLAILRSGSWADVRLQLLRWKANDIRVQRLLPSNSLLAEVSLLSNNAAIAANLALQAIVSIEAGRKRGSKSTIADLRQIKSLDVHTAALQIAFLPGVILIINASE